MYNNIALVGFLEMDRFVKNEFQEIRWWVGKQSSHTKKVELSLLDICHNTVLLYQVILSKIISSWVKKSFLSMVQSVIVIRYSFLYFRVCSRSEIKDEIIVLSCESDGDECRVAISKSYLTKHSEFFKVKFSQRWSPQVSWIFRCFFEREKFLII